MRDKLRILIVDDHTTFRSALRTLLRNEPTFEIVGEVSSGVEAVEMADALAPDVTVMDVSMPGTINGIDATRAIIAHAEPTGRHPTVIGLTASGEQVRSQMLDAGAAACLSKDRADEIIAAIKAACGSRPSPHDRPVRSDVLQDARPDHVASPDHVG